MSYKLILTGATLLSLLGCATPSVPLPPSSVPAALTEPCPSFENPVLSTNADLARAYVEALKWGEECSIRHEALSEAVRKK